ncbi:MAG: acetylglutamate kinase [Veillonellaceae bacterium]|nr:acetylglutamate kinase [Veillonellaceae bacterium]
MSGTAELNNWRGRTVVVKYGGNAMLDDSLKQAVAQDIADLSHAGVRLVIVHGGGPEITGLLKAMNKKSEFVAGLRVTDAETATLAQMALVGKTNPELVNFINRAGVRAVGLNGKDADLFEVRRQLATVYENGVAQQVDIGFVGEVASVRPELLQTLLDGGYVPVIAPIGADAAGQTYNINADTAAAAVAAQLQADVFLLLTDVEGVFRDYHDKNSLIAELSFEEATAMIKTGVVDGGMIPKVQACMRALAKGARLARVVDGRRPHCIVESLQPGNVAGTAVVKNKG